MKCVLSRVPFTLAAFSLPVVLSLPATLSAQAQSLWLGGRVGTLGAGADVSLALNDFLVLRGGAGLLDVEADLTSVSGLADNRTGILALPRAIYTIGADLEIGNFRIGGGMMHKSEDPWYAITLRDEARISIGERSYAHPQVTRVKATLRSDPWAPYALVGFGQHRSSGLGLFLDVGVVFLDRSHLSISASGEGSVLRSRSFREDLRAETASVRDELGDLVNYWPILNLGIRYGIGGDHRRGRGR